MGEFFSKINSFFGWETPADELVRISFPGLGIGEFEVNKIAIPLGENGIRWYGIIITLGMIVAVTYAIWRAKQKGNNTDDLIDMALYTILLGVIGARLYYVIFNGNVRSFYDVIAIWDGGLAIYGGIIGGVLGIFLVCKFKKLHFFSLLDCIGPGVMIAQAMGRWGNFFNGEAYGGIIAEGSPFYFLRMGLLPNSFGREMAYVHPTFLYESLWNVVGFVLMNVFYKKKKFDGEGALWYFGWYGLGRMAIEGLRQDSLMFFDLFRVSQVLAAVCVVASVTLIVVGRVKCAKKEKAGVAAVEATDEIEETVESVESQECAQQNVEETNTEKESQNGEDH